MLENEVYYIVAVKGFDVKGENVTNMDSDNYYCENKEQALDCIEHCLLSRKYISINVSIQPREEMRNMS